MKKRGVQIGRAETSNTRDKPGRCSPSQIEMSRCRNMFGSNPFERRMGRAGKIARKATKPMGETNDERKARFLSSEGNLTRVTSKSIFPTPHGRVELIN